MFNHFLDIPAIFRQYQPGPACVVIVIHNCIFDKAIVKFNPFQILIAELNSKFEVGGLRIK
jgi:hypothetical protein